MSGAGDTGPKSPLHETPRILAERVHDHAAVRRLLLDAFPSSAEADLVDALRIDGDAIVSLVAIEDDRVVGHLMLSAMQAPFRALGLGPLAVAADRRGRGLGAALIAEGAARAKADGWAAIFVLGAPDYYGRFGFRSDLASSLECPYAGPYFMVLPLDGASLPCASGKVDYAPAFASLG